MTFADSKALTTDTLQLQMHMKTAILEQIMYFTLQNLRRGNNEEVTKQRTSVGDNQSSIIPKHSEKVGIKKL